MDKIEKLVFTAKDFKFNAAYQEYDKAFDSTDSGEEKNQLNALITKLFEGEIQYPDYYQAIRDSENWYRFHRTNISTTRKFAYRKNQQKKARMERHR
jgi:hypothetical protein